MQHSKRASKPKLLVTLEMDHLPDLREALASSYDVVFATRPQPEDFPTLLGDRQAWLVDPCHIRVDRALLGFAPDLEFVGSASTGSNHLDLVEMERRNIRACYLRGTPVIEDVHASAEFSFTLMLNVVKRAMPAFEAARYGVWREAGIEFRGIEVHGKTIGLVGLGRIGRKMASFAHAFGMNILGCDPNVSCQLPGLKQVALDHLLKHSDIVCVHVHLSDETRGLFDKSCFNKMKAGAYFINTSRGEIVDEADLIDALQDGHIAAAGVDVISGEFEDGKYNHPMLKYARTHNNLLVSPHIAGNTVDSTRKTAAYVIDQMNDYFHLQIKSA